MAATPYSLRYLTNKSFYDDDDNFFGKEIPFQSNLEKGGRAMRYAINTVQYYSPRYDYRSVVADKNEQIKSMFDYNEFGK